MESNRTCLIPPATLTTGVKCLLGRFIRDSRPRVEWWLWTRPLPVHACVLSCFSHVWLCSPMDCSPPGSSCHGLEYWSGLPWSPSGDPPYPGIKPASLIPPALAGGFFILVSPGKPTRCLACANSRLVEGNSVFSINRIAYIQYKRLGTVRHSYCFWDWWGTLWEFKLPVKVPLLQAGISKLCSLRPAVLTLFCALFSLNVIL